MEREHKRKEQRRSVDEANPLRPDLRAIRDSVPAEQYGQASAGAIVELNRRGRRRYAIT